MKPLDLNGLKTYELRSRPSKVFVEDLGKPVAPDDGGRRRRLARYAAASAGGQRSPQSARSPVPRPRRRPHRRRRPRRPRHQDRLRPLSDRLDPSGIAQGRCPERRGGDPRLRAGLRRQDERGRWRPAQGGQIRHGPRDRRRLRRRRPRRGRERNRPRRRSRRLHRRATLSLRRAAAWSTPPIAPASPAPFTSLSAPTSFTCTRTSPAPPWAKRR